MGDEIVQGLGIQQDIGTVEKGGIVVGAVVGQSGSNITIGEHRDGPTYEEGSTHEERHINTGGGAYVEGNVDVNGDFVGRDRITTSYGVSGSELGELFEKVNALIGQAKINPDYDRDEVKETAKRIEKEVAKGDSADVGKVERRLKTLLDMAPDVAEVVVAGLANPIAGVAAAVTKLAKRLQASPG